MRAVIQRTTQSQVTVDGELVGKAGAGLTVLLGVGAEDTAEMQVTLTNNGPVTILLDSGKLF